MLVFEKEIAFGSTLVSKSFEFSKRIINSYKILSQRDSSIYPLYKQLLKSGTSIGANIAEAQTAFSKKDFISKLGIALKEAKETEYWLKLLNETNYITEKEFKSLFFDCAELLKMLTASIKTSKSK
jgi:four helix bundle protein